MKEAVALSFSTTTIRLLCWSLCLHIYRFRFAIQDADLVDLVDLVDLEDIVDSLPIDWLCLR